ncbi:MULTISPECIES: glutamine--fructose-6-phosphate transaminase (isomerizing) [Cycloclasticus]|uniref:Glutamine--fructose-6-phosphate aminotransferase [isomerizing] n=1 Tax=Cycloclasticus pugetii TaxID=34068 RepID=A0AB33YYA5_9GAMM|nr:MULTISPECIES: glutamine--fructose-6-phosphate transaminase (isomerizing) [Cycloclasticus]ATI02234.1 glutamine--fructose-6-phosphate transaminase (isomerizing) [Cycloclasticus sp. PY97N]EPD12200.1 glucosamine--fructose-6-phosphate aminotransferase [Cycloclasticus pugetii]
MCGIVGAVSQRDITNILVKGLQRLEYRGYDSAGVCIVTDNDELERRRTVGKVKNLEKLIEAQPLSGFCGIAHTRWATHGVPSETNAHPHMCADVALVHNGIIENYEVLRKQQLETGHQFDSDTDTEVIVHAVSDAYKKTNDLLTSVQKTVESLEGAYALGVVEKGNNDHLIAVRKGSPLVIGIGNNEHFIASDVFALLGEAEHFIYLEDGDVADITHKGVAIYDAKGRQVKRKINKTKLQVNDAGIGEYDHYMQKEIFEQAAVLKQTLEGRIANGRLLSDCFGKDAEEAFRSIEEVQIVACGTSFHAGLVAKYWFESVAGLPCHIEVASEFRYRPHIVIRKTLFVTISQSGETADTLAALQAASDIGYAHTLTICNVPESSLVRESEWALMTKAGPEIGVASTKAFTTQLTALLLLVIALGKHHKIDDKKEIEIVRQLEVLPEQVAEVLRLEPDIIEFAKQFSNKHHALFLGRGEQYPVAMEGALKLKEISYIHAEAYPAGELKHGPLALVDDQMPVVAVAPNNDLLEKLKSNLQEVQARGGELFVFADTHAIFEEVKGLKIIRVSEINEIVAPIIYTVPLQLLAYHVAVIKGTDVDQPRNLAKSVTVE